MIYNDVLYTYSCHHHPSHEEKQENNYTEKQRKQWENNMNMMNTRIEFMLILKLLMTQLI